MQTSFTKNCPASTISARPPRVDGGFAFKPIRLFRLVLLAACLNVIGNSTFAIASEPKVGQPPIADEDSDPSALVSAQIRLLNNPSYRVRQVARGVVERYPAVAMEVIGREINQVDAVVGVQLVDLLSGLAMHSDLNINSRAVELLEGIANDATSVGRVANNCLSSIADLHEQKAIDILRQHGAYIGPQNFSINGKEPELQSLRLSLAIDEHFTGSDSDLHWIRYLKSVQMVYLRGSKISPAALEATSQLKQLRGVKLRSCQITHGQLLRFYDLQSLEQFGLSYVNVDDSFVPIIEKLPISDSIRLYGTKISEQGRARLAGHFEGVEVFRGSGGFLGISSTGNSTIVSGVTPRSAADLAGIRKGDRIIAIDGAGVSTFDALRRELGKCEAGDSVDVTLQKIFDPFSPDESKPLEYTVKVTLQEET